MNAATKHWTPEEMRAQVRKLRSAAYAIPTSEVEPQFWYDLGKVCGMLEMAADRIEAWERQEAAP